MTEINSLSGTTMTAQSALAGGSGDISEEFDSFIRLLVAQVRNQDPLEPLDSTQFVEQLATFSSLEQQVNSNDSLSYIASAMADLQQMMASEWIGRSVSVPSSAIAYSGQPVAFEADLPAGTERAVLSVLSADGTLLSRQELAANEGVWQWNGETAAGVDAPHGRYLMAIEAFGATGSLGAVTPVIRSTVTSVATDSEGRTTLQTDNGLSVQPGAFRASEPQPTGR